MKMARICFNLVLLRLTVGVQLDSFLRKATQRESSPLPLHLLDLDHQLGKASYLEWDLCSTQVHSNLGGQGPDVGAEELRFSSVGKIQESDFDLVLTTESPYSVNNAMRNTARGCFGVINVAKDSNVSLKFSFVYSGTNDLVTLNANSVYLSFFDLDCSSTGCESITVDYAQGKNFHVADNTELAIAHIYSDIDKEFLRLDASSYGTGSDNPPPLEALQQSRAITFELGAPTVVAQLEVPESNVGRNFLIGGKTTLVPKATTTTTTLGGKEQSHGDCIVWGDPHIITFDVHKKRLAQHPMKEAFFRTRGWKSDQVSIYDEGTFWLVKTDLVHIQARYWHNLTHPDWTNLGALAIGGPFLDNNTLVIRSLSAPTTWNGAEILTVMPSKFDNSFISATYDRGSELVKDGRRGPGIDVQLPLGVSLVVNRWKQSIAVKITMFSQHNQSGQCGNFNGNPNDDFQEVLSGSIAQKVPSHQFLFEDRKDSKK